MAAKTYTALTGINYTTAKGEVRVEAGKTIDDLPPKSASWLLEQGLIEQAGKTSQAKEAND